MENYKEYNAIRVYEKLLEIEKELLESGRSSVSIREICKQLSVFDWFTNTLSKNRLAEMKSFLRTAIRLGFTGYVCFKVGCSGTANGMWAYKEETTNGYSPDGPCLYKTFTPAYNYWCVDLDGKSMRESPNFATIKELKAYVKVNKK